MWDDSQQQPDIRVQAHHNAMGQFHFYFGNGSQIKINHMCALYSYYSNVKRIGSRMMQGVELIEDGDEFGEEPCVCCCADAVVKPERAKFMKTGM